MNTSSSRAQLMETLLGHMALLAERHPEKAQLPVVKSARRAVEDVLEQERLLEQQREALAAAVAALNAPMTVFRRAA